MQFCTHFFYLFISTEFWSTLWKSCCSCCRSHSECKRKGKSIPVHSVEDSTDSCEKKFRLGSFLGQFILVALWQVTCTCAVQLWNVYLPRKTPFTKQYWYSFETCIFPGKRHLPNNTGTRVYICICICIFFRPQVVIDAFRLINPNMMVLGQESRQTTSNLGHLQKPSIQVSLLKNEGSRWNVGNSYSRVPA